MADDDDVIVWWRKASLVKASVHRFVQAIEA
jgi:hypothetical protein